MDMEVPVIYKNIRIRVKKCQNDVLFCITIQYLLND